VCEAVTCRWEVEGEVEEIGIPETLYGVLRARIDQLPVGARHTLQLAAVLGRIFPYRLLADIADRRALDEYLVTLQREQLLRERARLSEAECIFKHQLTLEAAYDGLPHRVRRVLHRRVAESLERLYPER
jgi:predicted ATPase